MKKSTLPNLLSLVRVVIAPLFFIWIVSGIDWKIQGACLLFLIGALTDYFDGWLARKLNAVTSWGRFMDPLADKILTTGAFVAFYFIDIMPLWMVIIIIIRDFGTTILRVFSKSLKKPVVTSFTAKVKTTLQMFFISVVLLLLLFKTFEQPYFTVAEINAFLSSVYMYLVMLLLTIITVATLIEYMVKTEILTFYPSRKFKN